MINVCACRLSLGMAHATSLGPKTPMIRPGLHKLAHLRDERTAGATGEPTASFETHRPEEVLCLGVPVVPGRRAYHLAETTRSPMACRSESCIVRYDKVESFELVLGILVRYGQGWPRLRRLKGFSFLFPVGDGMAVVIPMVLGCELMRLKALQKRSGSID